MKLQKAKNCDFFSKINYKVDYLLFILLWFSSDAVILIVITIHQPKAEATVIHFGHNVRNNGLPPLKQVTAVSPANYKF